MAKSAKQRSKRSRSEEVAEQFPALKGLGFLTARKAVPFVQQLEWTDCGAASLCMVMAYHGRVTKLSEVREAMGIGRDGVSAKAILDTAERYGMCGRGIKVDLSQVGLLKIGTILHPSPASPAANRGWEAAAERQLKDLAVW